MLMRIFDDCNALFATLAPSGGTACAGPDKGPFDDLVVGVLKSCAQPAVSAHQGPPP